MVWRVIKPDLFFLFSFHLSRNWSQWQEKVKALQYACFRFSWHRMQIESSMTIQEKGTSIPNPQTVAICVAAGIKRKRCGGCFQLRGATWVCYMRHEKTVRREIMEPHRVIYVVFTWEVFNKWAELCYFRNVPLRQSFIFQNNTVPLCPGGSHSFIHLVNHGSKQLYHMKYSASLAAQLNIWLLYDNDKAGSLNIFYLTLKPLNYQAAGSMDFYMCYVSLFVTSQSC